MYEELLEPELLEDLEHVSSDLLKKKVVAVANGEWENHFRRLKMSRA